MLKTGWRKQVCLEEVEEAGVFGGGGGSRCVWRRWGKGVCLEEVGEGGVWRRWGKGYVWRRWGKGVCLEEVGEGGVFGGRLEKGHVLEREGVLKKVGKQYHITAYEKLKNIGVCIPGDTLCWDFITEQFGKQQCTHLVFL